MFVTPSGERDQPSAESPNKFMQTVLTPAVLEAEKHYYGRTYPSFADAPETDALRDEEIEFIEKVVPPSGHGAKVERVFIIDILSYDWNCPKFITPRYTAVEIEHATAPLRQRITELEAKVS